jgi:hypothetical protein
MIADSGWCFGLPSVLLKPVNSPSKFVDRYRGISGGLAFVMAAAASFVLAAISGILAAIAGTYLYDRANGKGDDAAVGLGGLFAVGTFTFVVVFTWLQKMHHSVSSRTSLFAFYACLIAPVAATVLLAEDMDDYYLFFVLGDWLAILLLGLLSLYICRRWWRKSDQGF